jgi:hypothetical protein
MSLLVLVAVLGWIDAMAMVRGVVAIKTRAGSCLVNMELYNYPFERGERKSESVTTIV